MSKREQRRAFVVTRLMSGDMGVAEAARLLSLSERSIRRLRARMEQDGPSGLVHGTGVGPRDAAWPSNTKEGPRDRPRALCRGVSDTHLAELLAERENITVSRAALRGLSRGAGRPAKRRRRCPGHRSRRDRMEREGMLLQTDGSRHDWREDRGRASRSWASSTMPPVASPAPRSETRRTQRAISRSLPTRSPPQCARRDLSRPSQHLRAISTPSSGSRRSVAGRGAASMIGNTPSWSMSAARDASRTRRRAICWV